MRCSYANANLFLLALLITFGKPVEKKQTSKQKLAVGGCHIFARAR